MLNVFVFDYVAIQPKLYASAFPVIENKLVLITTSVSLHVTGYYSIYTMDYIKLDSFNK